MNVKKNELYDVFFLRNKFLFENINRLKFKFYPLFYEKINKAFFITYLMTLKLGWYHKYLCRKQFLTDFHLVILNCVYIYETKHTRTFVRSINNSYRNSCYSMYCMDVAISTELNSYFQFQLNFEDDMSSI